MVSISPTPLEFFKRNSERAGINVEGKEGALLLSENNSEHVVWVKKRVDFPFYASNWRSFPTLLQCSTARGVGRSCSNPLK